MKSCLYLLVEELESIGFSKELEDFIEIENVNKILF